MTDPFETQSPGLEAPAAGAFAITPSDSTALENTPRALYVGGGGMLVVEMKWGGEATFANLPDACLLPIRVTRVLAATTATSIVGLY